jgi:hypothetical protein
VPLDPEAAAFADHYGFTIDVLAAYRPTGKGRVERQVNIVRPCNCRQQLRLDPRARRRLRRTGFRSADPRCIAPHGKVIAVRAQADWATLRGLPDQPLWPPAARCHREFARSLSWVQWTRTACGFLNKHGAG